MTVNKANGLKTGDWSVSVQAKALPYIGQQSFSLVITVDGVVLPPTVGSGPTPLSQTLLQKCPATKLGMTVIYHAGYFYTRTPSLSISLYHSLSLSLSLSLKHILSLSLSLTHTLSHCVSLSLSPTSHTQVQTLQPLSCLWISLYGRWTQ